MASDYPLSDAYTRATSPDGVSSSGSTSKNAGTAGRPGSSDVDVFEALAEKLGVDRREAKRLILNAVYSEDARYKRSDNLPIGHELFGITMSHDQLEAAIGAGAVATIEEANFVLVPREWRERAIGKMRASVEHFDTANARTSNGV